MRICRMGGKTVVVTPLAPGGYCVNLFGVLFTRDISWIGPALINHEKIHDAQQRELLYLPFYLLYVVEWVVRLFQYRDFPKAYRNISFEREAYAHGGDLDYLSERRRFAWRRYLFRS